jgi:hypothetical protein
MYNFRRAPIVQRTEQSTPKALMWVQFPLGAYKSDKTSQEFLAGLRFEQKGKLDELPKCITFSKTGKHENEDLSKERP